MSFGFLKTLFRREGGAVAPELRGPLDLGPGDRVDYYQRGYYVTGVVALAADGLTIHQYGLRDADGTDAILSVDAANGDEPVLSLQEIVPEDARPEVGPDGIVVGGAPLRRVREVAARALVAGDVRPEKSGEVRVVAYEDDEEIRVVVAETWPGYVEVRAGEYLYENELDFRREGQEERFEVRPPPKLDRRSILEARRARAEARAAKAASPAPPPPADAEDDGPQPSMS